jgi:hypothetical protein
MRKVGRNLNIIIDLELSSPPLKAAGLKLCQKLIMGMGAFLLLLKSEVSVLKLTTSALMLILLEHKTLVFLCTKTYKFPPTKKTQKLCKANF